MTLSLSRSPVYLSAMGMICALGRNNSQILANLLAGSREGMVLDQHMIPGKNLRLGKVTGPLSDKTLAEKTLPPWEQSRNNQLLLAALTVIRDETNRLINHFWPGPYWHYSRHQHLWHP